MVKEAYCSFEVSKLLKERGFNWRTQYVYTLDGTGSTPPKIGNWRTKSDIQKPTHQMAMRWLREKNIIIVIQPEYFNAESKCSAWGVDIWADDNYEKLQGDFPSYEEAVEVALKYVLENLILLWKE